MSFMDSNANISQLGVSDSCVHTTAPRGHMAAVGRRPTLHVEQKHLSQSRYKPCLTTKLPLLGRAQEDVIYYSEQIVTKQRLINY